LTEVTSPLLSPVRPYLLGLIEQSLDISTDLESLDLSLSFLSPLKTHFKILRLSLNVFS
jgi:hypothetical protein